MIYQYHDGGRENAGFKGNTDDCVCRAIAIAEDKPYKEVYKELKSFLGKGRSPRNRIPTKDVKKFLEQRGWVWKATSGIGKKEVVHMREEELPQGTVIVRVSKHVACIKNGVLYDNHDCTRDGLRKVYGYWIHAGQN